MNLLSVDVEDWYTSGRIKDFIDIKAVKPRIDYTVKSVLEVFEANNVKATFFTLGVIAQKHPDIIKLIGSYGHEIASHGMYHEHLWKFTAKEFKTHISESNKILEDLAGAQIKGFRAPFASLNEESAWLIDLLEEFNFEYDSSVFPMRTPLYGLNHTPLSLYKIKSENLKAHSSDARIIEIPFTIYKKGFVKIPCTGAIYARFIPLKIFTYLLKSIEKERSINFYFHPWETDKDIPKVNLPIYNNLFAYYNTSSYLNKIDYLLKNFQFTSFSSYLKTISL